MIRLAPRPRLPLYPPLEELRLAAERALPGVGIPASRRLLLARVRGQLGDWASLTDLDLAWRLVRRDW